MDRGREEDNKGNEKGLMNFIWMFLWGGGVVWGDLEWFFKLDILHSKSVVIQVWASLDLAVLESLLTWVLLNLTITEPFILPTMMFFMSAPNIWKSTVTSFAIISSKAVFTSTLFPLKTNLLVCSLGLNHQIVSKILFPNSMWPLPHHLKFEGLF